MASINSCIAVHYPKEGIIPESDVLVAKRAEKILKIFDDITTAMSGQKYTTISNVMVLVEEMTLSVTKEMDDQSNPDEISELLAKLHQEIVRRFRMIGTKSPFALATLLDPRIKEHGFLVTDDAQAMKEELLKECQKVVVDVAVDVPEKSCKAPIVSHGRRDFQILCRGTTSLRGRSPPMVERKSEEVPEDVCSYEKNTVHSSNLSALGEDIF